MAASMPDVVVVGGGVIGQSVAFELASGGLSVRLVFPRGHGPDSASLAAGAMVGAFSDPRELDSEAGRAALDFRLASQDLFPSYLGRIREAGGSRIQVNPGIFMIANGRGRRDHAHVHDLQVALDLYGRPNEWVAPADIPGLRPAPSCPVERALFIPGDFSVDSADLLNALTATLEATPNVAIVDDHVTGINQAASGWEVVGGTTGAMSTAHVVVCAGARVPEVLGPTVLDRLRLPTLYFAKGFGCVVSGAPAFPHTIRTPDRSDACGVHAVPRAGGRLYLGAATHYGHATAAARGVTPGECFAILGDTNREINRSLRDTTIEEMRIGLRPLSVDDEPLVGRTALDGLHLATATFRLGFVMAPLIARVVAAEVSGESPPVFNPWPASAARRGREPTSYDANVANLLINDGLVQYNRGRGADDGDALKQAADVWRRYIELVGDDADVRIVELVSLIERGSDLGDEIW